MFMSGTTINALVGVRGSEAGKGWKQSDICGARPSLLYLVGKKLVLFAASIAFLLTLLAPFLVFSQVAAGLITSTQTPSRQIRLALKIIW